jgi:hypothetical protein
MLPLSAGAALLAVLSVAVAAAAGTPARAATADISGAPYAWGDNSFGELGDATGTQHDSPEPVTLASGVTATAVSAGGTFSLAIGSDGNLYAWGDNTAGELGDSTSTQHESPEPVTLATGVKPAAISAGEVDSLAIGSDGNLYAWGDNSNGELGDGTTTSRNSPEVVTLADGVKPTAISAGKASGGGLAIGSDGNLYAWGDNSNGQLGDGTTTGHDSPEVVTLADGVKPTAISAGVLNNLAVGSDGKLYAWGYNGDGELGDGSTTDQDSPEVITLAAGVTPTGMSAGADFSLAIGSDGNLYAWGDNTFGELGDGTTTSHHSPEVITLATGVKPTSVSAAGFDGLAIGSDGNLYAWGSNTVTISGATAPFGELGDGTTANDDSPEVITLGPGVAPVAVSAGLFDTLAIGAACSDSTAGGATTTAPTCPATPTTSPSATTSSGATPTPGSTTRSSATPKPGATAKARTSAPAAAPANTPAGAAAAVQAAADAPVAAPVGAPDTGGGTGAGISVTLVAAGAAVAAAGTGLVALARRRGRRRPPV